MSGGRVKRALAIATLLALAGCEDPLGHDYDVCEAWCEDRGRRAAPIQPYSPKRCVCVDVAAAAECDAGADQ